MEFTTAGLAFVKSENFARSMDDYFSPWREQRLSDLELTKLAAGVVSWAATGHALSEPPAGRQSYELTAFVLCHLNEVNDLCDIVGKNMVGLVRPQ